MIVLTFKGVVHIVRDALHECMVEGTCIFRANPPHLVMKQPSWMRVGMVMSRCSNGGKHPILLYSIIRTMQWTRRVNMVTRTYSNGGKRAGSDYITRVR